MTGMKNIVYFDLETQKSAEDVGGWDKISRMQMSVGVTYSTARRDYRIYSETKVNDLITELVRADLVVGFNNLRFDYEVLHGYTTLDLDLHDQNRNTPRFSGLRVSIQVRDSATDKPVEPHPGKGDPTWSSARPTIAGTR